MEKETRNKILSASIELFVTDGYEKASIEAISKKAGVSRMMIYYYFKNKEEILISILQQMFSNAIKSIEDYINLEQHFNPAEELYETIKSIFLDRLKFAGFVITEILKGGLKDLPVFLYIRDFYKAVIETLFKKKVFKSNSWLNEVCIEIIFFNALPFISFNLLKDRLEKELGIEKERLEEVFNTKFISNLKESFSSMEEER